MINASEQRSVKKISDCEKLGKEYQSEIIAQIKHTYAKLKKKIIEKLSVEIDTNAETVKPSEFVKPVTVPSQKSTSKEEVQQEMMEMINASEQRSVKKLVIVKNLVKSTSQK
ncbi:hypothetical protein TNCV_1694771 [Trichonephila clavipes]|nr:hypothetical protein TNCV_1694771 [Trichonephila clavipes]